MTSHIIDEFFAWFPLTAFATVLVILYFATRAGQTRSTAPVGKTYACARCGRRGQHEQMTPVTEAGAVLWYCGRCM